MSEAYEITTVWLKLKEAGFCILQSSYGDWDFEDALSVCRETGIAWEIDMMTPVGQCITVAHSRTDAPGTMAALYAAGKMTGSAP